MPWLQAGGLSEILPSVNYVFTDVAARDLFFTNNPGLLIENVLIFITDATPAPTPGTRNLDFSKPFNSMYKTVI